MSNHRDSRDSAIAPNSSRMSEWGLSMKPPRPVGSTRLVHAWRSKWTSLVPFRSPQPAKWQLPATKHTDTIALRQPELYDRCAECPDPIQPTQTERRDITSPLGRSVILHTCEYGHGGFEMMNSLEIKTRADTEALSVDTVPQKRRGFGILFLINLFRIPN